MLGWRKFDSCDCNVTSCSNFEMLNIWLAGMELCDSSSSGVVCCLVLSDLLA